MRLRFRANSNHPSKATAMWWGKIVHLVSLQEKCQQGSKGETWSVATWGSVTAAQRVKPEKQPQQKYKQRHDLRQLTINQHTPSGKFTKSKIVKNSYNYKKAASAGWLQVQVQSSCP